jgi:succinylglutamic semialdehyde dehydrogenase
MPRDWHASLLNPPSDLVGGEWVALAGSAITSRNPAHPAEVVWSGSPMREHLDRAVAAARGAFPVWANWGRERRFAVLRRYQQICKAREKEITDLICDETGKVLWDAAGESGLLGAKVDITLDESATGPMRRVSGYEVALGATRAGKAWFRPHGVMAVLGPYNFPAHLPNGHIVPALAMGNTVVLKPSDKAPAVGQMLAELFWEALDAEGAPAGVFNLVQGGADIASALVKHEGINGVLFTGSWPVGRKIMEANLDRPDRILALEMGGNNPAVVMPDADLNQALVECVRCAFITTGQRCTCTRRIIVHEAVATRFISAFCKAASSLIVGDPRATHPVFMGPIIGEQARKAVLDFQTALARAGGGVLVESTPVDIPGGGWYLTPCVVKVDGFSTSDSPGDAGCDLEVFGPLVRVCVVRSLKEAIAQANASRYGLAASIFCKEPREIEKFLNEAVAGCLNVNAGTAGASSKLPFGGLGLSGNHRPAGAFSLDYCAYPVAGMMEKGSAATMAAGMRIEQSWLS